MNTRRYPAVTKRTHRTATAACDTCGAAWDNANALATASIHARSHGHVVRGVLEVAVTYDGAGRRAAA